MVRFDETHIPQGLERVSQGQPCETQSEMVPGLLGGHPRGTDPMTGTYWNSRTVSTRPPFSRFRHPLNKGYDLFVSGRHGLFLRGGCLKYTSRGYRRAIFRIGRDLTSTY